MIECRIRIYVQCIHCLLGYLLDTGYHMIAIRLAATDRSCSTADCSVRECFPYLPFSTFSRTQAVIDCTWRVIVQGPMFISLAAFTVYGSLGYQLTAATAFPALSLFNLLRFPLMMLPEQILNLIQVHLFACCVKDKVGCQRALLTKLL